MCIHFHVTKVVVTTGPATLNGYTNPDIPVGTVLAFDEHGGLYRCTVPGMFGGSGSQRPMIHKQPIMFYRDYWKHVANDGSSLYMRALMAAPTRVLDEVV